MSDDNDSRMGLTDKEVKWLQAKMSTNETARKLVNQYKMIISCPNDLAAREIFKTMRDDWRKTRREDALRLPNH